MKTEDLVQKIVQEHPEAGNDDKILLIYVWEAEGLILSKAQKAAFLERCTAAETITRARRYLVQNGLINTSPEAKERRESLGAEFRRRFSSQKTLHSLWEATKKDLENS
jgi:hypothetical protein